MANACPRTNQPVSVPIVNRYQFTLSLSPEQCQKYYSGHASSVLVRTSTGLSLAFPAVELRRFVRFDGVHGRFEIRFDANHKLLSLARVSCAA